MKICNILSNREHVAWPSWHIIHEWEDIFSDILQVPLKNSKKLEDKYHSIYKNPICRKLLSYRTIRKTFNLFQKRSDSKCKSLVFDLVYYPRFSYTNDINSIPIIIDFWKETNLDDFNDSFRNCSLVLISSLEVFNYLKSRSCTVNIKFLALSLPDRYILELDYDKKYDIIFAGRKNPVLWSFMVKYEQKHPDIEYLYQVQIDGELYYKSNKSGIIGKYHTREEYFNLLTNCRIGMYSTPGIDGGEERTGGFNPVTPRYLEYLAAGCLLIGRYPQTEETDFFSLASVCPNVESYQQFESLIDKYLNEPEVPTNEYKRVLEQHYTSVRGNELSTILKNL